MEDLKIPEEPKEVGGTFDCPVCGLSYIHTHELHRISSSNAPAQIVSDMLEACKREIRYLAESEYQNRCEGEIWKAERLYGLLKQIASASGTSVPRKDFEEMRDALKAFADAAESWHSFHNHTDIQCDQICACIAPAKAALAKAGFGQP